MNAEQQKQFMTFMKDYSGFLNQVNFINMQSVSRDLDSLEVNKRAMRWQVENADNPATGTAAHTRRQLRAQGIIMPYFGLPVPTTSDLDTTANAADTSGTHNQFWNWVYNCLWVRDIIGSNRRGRGYTSATSQVTTTANDPAPGFGWRPVLESLNGSPEIAGQDTDLGTLITGIPLQAVTITDDSDEVNATIILNGKTIDSFPVELGQETQINVSDEQWLVVRNGDGELVLSVTDGEYTVQRVWSFNKAVTTIELKRKTPLPADDRPAKASMKITGSLPEGIELIVRVCNNGNDENPTWEDVTQLVKNGKNFPLNNTEKTAEEWGFNYWIELRRGTAEGDINIKMLSGTYTGDGGDTQTF